jgi:CheY-like chemotaxis protein
MTGYGQESDRKRSQEAGFNHHLVKPVKLATLEKLLAAPAALSPSLEQSNPTGASLRVLVVDDMRDTTHMLRRLLNAAGHEVRTASDGPSALAAALDFQPEVALLDISLPGMSGLELAKQIRQQSKLKDIVLVAMTGYGDEADRQRSLEAGFDHHLVKPADIRNVLEILATVSARGTE